VGSRSSLILVNFGPGVSAQGQKVKKFGNAHLVDRLRVCTLWGSACGDIRQSD